MRALHCTNVFVMPEGITNKFGSCSHGLQTKVGHYHDHYHKIITKLQLFIVRNSLLEDNPTLKYTCVCVCVCVRACVCVWPYIQKYDWPVYI